ncbi:MAG: sugar transferase [Clostridia bacterium]|nr:sugar transferase [Clostridia bacterium]
MYKRNNQGWLKHLDFILWDVFSLQIAFILAYTIRHGGMPYGNEVYRTLAIMLVVVDILIADIFNTMHGVMKRGYYQEAIQTLKQAALVLAVVSLYMFSVQSGDIYSRITIFLTAVFHFILGYGVRMAWKPIVRRIAKKSRKAAMILVADEKQVSEVLAMVSDTDDVEYSGIVLSNRDGTGGAIDGVPVVASLETAADYICREWVDEVFVYPAQLTDIEVRGSGRDVLDGGLLVDDAPEEATVAGLIEACRQMAVPVHIRLPISNISDRSFIERVAGYDVLTSAANYASPRQLALKRAMDIVGGLVGSLIALVVIAVVGPVIKRESPGPILFKQTRIGKNGRKFQIYKIRSMYLDAEERKAELMKNNRVSDGMMFKLDWDPRIIGNKIVDGKQVTGIGEKIRSGSWDEWPQFFNVLRGQMSLVGTRPPTVDEWEKYKYHHRARLSTKPGLTGMWQVSGRSRITDFEEVVKLDTEYINHWSIGLDIRILIKTVKTVFTKDGAM